MLSWLFDMIVGADGPAIRAMLDEEDNKEKAKRERAKYMAKINKTRYKDSKSCICCSYRFECKKGRECRIFK